MNSELHKIGDPIGDDPPSVFELIIKDHVAFVNPKTYRLSKTDSINPADYFITSGDAVEKARILERDLWNLAGAIRKRVYGIIEKEQKCTHVEAQVKWRKGIRPIKPRRLPEYENAIWKAAGQARKLVVALLTAKGVDIFLETEWNNHKLLCIPKNPRK